MATLSRSKLFASPRMDSKITSANTTKKEMCLGYFCGPMMLYMVYWGIATTYLNQFYTDVLGLSATAGTFLTLMPIFSKIVDAITNLVMGRIIDKTRTRQGKARPWILIAGVLVTLTGIMLYAIPQASLTVQCVWIVVSYNLFFALAFTVYNMSHTLMLPLSTRNIKQRDTLSLLTSTGTSMIPGLLVVAVMPSVIAKVGVGPEAQSGWLLMMSLISILAIPAVLLEYFFTKERVTEENMNDDGTSREEVVPFKDQVKACFTNKYWVLIILFILVYQIVASLSTSTLLYFCNWVMGSSINDGTASQATLNIIGQAPLGFGLIAFWPLVRKFGKRKVSLVCFILGIVGCAVCLSNPKSMTTMLGGLFIKACGLLPTYVMMAFVAEALDHIEWKNKFRADGFSASVYSIILTIASGIGTGILNFGIAHFGYIRPESAEQIIEQPAALQSFFSFCYVGSYLLAFCVGIFVLIFYKVEKQMPTITEEINARHRAEAEARGEVYYTAEEKSAMEIAEQARIAEENRVAELQALCAKNGWDYDTEEAKYQAEKAVKDEEARLKQAVKAAKGAEKKAKKMELKAHQEMMKKK